MFPKWGHVEAKDAEIKRRMNFDNLFNKAFSLRRINKVSRKSNAPKNSKTKQ